MRQRNISNQPIGSIMFVDEERTAQLSKKRTLDRAPNFVHRVNKERGVLGTLGALSHAYFRDT